ncbi:hypothetical protein FRC04_007453 [Tulasnella sp. 424]|nr:hypothetical protein FRC04_007453 [Tulasnella sp. 424]
MRSFRRVHRRVLGSWLCLLFLLSLVFDETGDASPTTAIIPFLASIPLVISHGATVFLVPDIVLSSSTPPPAPRPHPTPTAASHHFNPPQGRWIISYHTTLDDQTLYNIAIRRPLNGTAKLVTRKHVTWIAPDEFAGASATGENDAALESRIYDTPLPLGLIGFPGLELGTNVEELHPLGTHSDKGRGISTSFTDFKHDESCLTELFVHRARTDIAFHPIASVFAGPRLRARILKDELERYGLVGIFLALAVVAFIIFLAADTIEPLIVKAVGLLRWTPEFATRGLAQSTSLRTHPLPHSLLSSGKKLAPKSLETGLPIEEIIKALDERFADRRDNKPVGPPFDLSPARAKLHRPGKLRTLTESGFTFLTQQDRTSSSNASSRFSAAGAKAESASQPRFWIPLPPATDMEREFLKEYTSSHVTTDDQAKQEVALEVQAVPLVVSTDTDANHPQARRSHRKTPLKVASNPDSFSVDEKKTEKEHSPALNLPNVAPNRSGIAVLSAQVSGPMPDGGSLGAFKLDSESSSSLTIERLRALILCQDTSSSASSPSKAHEFECRAVCSSKRVGGTSDGFPWKVGANIDRRAEDPNRKGRSGGHKRGATVARLDTIAEDVSDSTIRSDAPTPPADADEPSNSGLDLSAQVSGTAPKTGFLGKLGSRRLEVEAAVASARQSRMVIQANIDWIEKASCLSTIAEDLEDSTVSSNTAVTATSASSSIPTTNTAAEPPTNADDHPLREARAAENAVEKNELKKLKSLVVTFSDEVQVRDLPMSKWESFYGLASTSRDGARRPLSEDEWNRLEKYQGVRSNPKEVVRTRPETAAMDVDVDVVFQSTFTLPLETPLIGARDHPSHNNPIGNTPPLALDPWTGLYYYVLCIPPLHLM